MKKLFVIFGMFLFVFMQKTNAQPKQSTVIQYRNEGGKISKVKLTIVLETMENGMPYPKNLTADQATEIMNGGGQYLRLNKSIHYPTNPFWMFFGEKPYLTFDSYEFKDSFVLKPSTKPLFGLSESKMLLILLFCLFLLGMGLALIEFKVFSVNNFSLILFYNILIFFMCPIIYTNGVDYQYWAHSYGLVIVNLLVYYLINVVVFIIFSFKKGRKIEVSV